MRINLSYMHTIMKVEWNSINNITSLLRPGWSP